MSTLQKNKSEVLQEIAALQERISALEQLHSAKIESEMRARLLAEMSFTGFVLSENGIIVDVNDQLAHLIGYQREELIGKPVMMVVAPESRDRVAQALEKKYHRALYDVWFA